jgi:hypothetical protein
VLLRRYHLKQKNSILGAYRRLISLRFVIVRSNPTGALGLKSNRVGQPCIQKMRQRLTWTVSLELGSPPVINSGRIGWRRCLRKPNFSRPRSGQKPHTAFLATLGEIIAPSQEPVRERSVERFRAPKRRNNRPLIHPGRCNHPKPSAITATKTGI